MTQHGSPTPPTKKYQDNSTEDNDTSVTAAATRGVEKATVSYTSRTMASSASEAAEAEAEVGFPQWWNSGLNISPYFLLPAGVDAFKIKSKPNSKRVSKYRCSAPAKLYQT